MNEGMLIIKTFVEHRSKEISHENEQSKKKKFIGVHALSVFSMSTCPGKFCHSRAGKR
jgi:glutaredoxin-related protein